MKIKFIFLLILRQRPGSILQLIIEEVSIVYKARGHTWFIQQSNLGPPTVLVGMLVIYREQDSQIRESLERLFAARQIILPGQDKENGILSLQDLLICELVIHLTKTIAQRYFMVKALLFNICPINYGDLCAILVCTSIILVLKPFLC